MKLEATSLHGRLDRRYDLEPRVLRVTSNPDVADRAVHALLHESNNEAISGFGGNFYRSHICDVREDLACFKLPPNLDYLLEGDVVRISPRSGELWVMYRPSARTNSVFLTERCNSWCVMCSQPPKPKDGIPLVDAWCEAIPLMHPDTPELGFTGGEPTLLGDQFLRLVAVCREHLPNTGIHLLSNGRMFSYLNFAEELAAIQHPDFVIGIPVYSDIAWRHEHVVQSPRSFDQTVRGILNLARVGLAVEIRVVLHRLTIERLPQLASYIARNFPFSINVALMGYEPIGFGRTNLNELWIDPVKYQAELVAAVRILDDHGLRVSIYNHQLCVLPESLWAFAVPSISDWKNIYLPVCASCEVRERCGGFFHSAVKTHSNHIHPIRQENL